MEAALEPVLEAGIPRIHEKAKRLTSYVVELTDDLLLPLGFEIVSPRDPARRGAHISLRHADAYPINRALIEEMNVVPDFREPDIIRLGLSPLYTSFEDVWTGIERIRQLVVEGRHTRYAQRRRPVT
jgi:kynureninase